MERWPLGWMSQRLPGLGRLGEISKGAGLGHENAQDEAGMPGVATGGMEERGRWVG